MSGSDWVLDEQLGDRDEMLLAAPVPASGRQPLARIAVVVELDNLDWLPDDVCIERQHNAVLERLAKCPELLVVAVGICQDVLEQLPDRLDLSATRLGFSRHVSNNSATVRIGKNSRCVSS